MKSLLLVTLIAYAVAAIHALLAFVNKRRSAEHTALWALGAGFALHTVALALDWAQDGHYPLFGLRETFSFLAWTLVIAYGLALYRYRARALGALTLPLVTLLVLVATLVRPTNGADATSVTAGAAGWLFPVHTTLLVCAYAAFFVVFAASVMYLWQERELKLKTFSAFFHRLPSLSTVDDIGATAGWRGRRAAWMGVAGFALVLCTFFGARLLGGYHVFG